MLGMDDTACSRFDNHETKMNRMTMLAAGLSFIIHAAASSAQGMGVPAGASAADCEQLAAMPNAPISVETCKAMFGMATSLEGAANDPRARRPGDEAMSCAQIFDELRTMTDVGLSKATTTQMAAVVQQGQASAARGTAEMTAFMAETTAIGIAMAAMGPYVPNLVGAAITAAWQAKATALGAKQQAEYAKLSAQMRPAFSAAAAELAQSMQSNPRFARLGLLAMKKECEPPAIEAK
jgi:hypothetical protein